MSDKSIFRFAGQNHNIRENVWANAMLLVFDGLAAGDLHGKLMEIWLFVVRREACRSLVLVVLCC